MSSLWPVRQASWPQPYDRRFYFHSMLDCSYTDPQLSSAWIHPSYCMARGRRPKKSHMLTAGKTAFGGLYSQGDPEKPPNQCQHLVKVHHTTGRRAWNLSYREIESATLCPPEGSTKVRSSLPLGAITLHYLRNWACVKRGNCARCCRCCCRGCCR